MIKKLILILAALLIGGCSINASFTCGQDYRPADSIWGNAQTDQEKCQAEADYMAKYRKFCHVGPCIGRFEGIGWSKSCAFPNTCVPSKKMRLTGDAVAITSNGITIRVRSWR